jgi:hypothetical protein
MVASAILSDIIRRQAPTKKGGSEPPRPYYPKERYVGGKDDKRDANCAPNVNNPSR